MSGLTVDQSAGRDRTADTLCKDRQSGSALLRWPPGTVVAGKAPAWPGAISPGVGTVGTQLHAVAHSAHALGKAHGASKVHRAGTAWQGKASVSMPFLGRSACNMAWPGTAQHRTGWHSEPSTIKRMRRGRPTRSRWAAPLHRPECSATTRDMQRSLASRRMTA